MSLSIGYILLLDQWKNQGFFGTFSARANKYLSENLSNNCLAELGQFLPELGRVVHELDHFHAVLWYLRLFLLLN